MHLRATRIASGPGRREMWVSRIWIRCFADGSGDGIIHGGPMPGRRVFIHKVSAGIRAALLSDLGDLPEIPPAPAR